MARRESHTEAGGYSDDDDDGGGDGGGGGGGLGGLREKFKTAKRRATQMALLKLGKSEASEDSEYEAKKAEVTALATSLKNLDKHLHNYLDASRALCLATSEIATDVRAVFGSAPDPSVSKSVDGFLGAACSIDDDVRKLMDSIFVMQVLEPLKEKLAEFEDLKKRMSQRESFKVDYDHYVRQVKELKSKPSSDAKRLGQKEGRLDETREILNGSTREVYDEFQWLNDRRPMLVLGELRTFVSCQQRFFGESARLLAGVPPLPVLALPARRAAAFKPITGGSARAGASHVIAAPGSRASEDMSRRASMDVAPAAAAAAAPPVAAAAPPPVPRASAPPPASKPPAAVAVYDYVPASADELHLHAGDEMEVLERGDDGWYKGRVIATGAEGMFPSNYIQES